MADAAAVADHYVTLQQLYPSLHTPLDYSRSRSTLCDLPLYSGVITRRFYSRRCIKIYDSCITPTQHTLLEERPGVAGINIFKTTFT